MVTLFTPGADRTKKQNYIKISVTNHGPGVVRIESIVGKNAPTWRRLFRLVQHFMVLEDNTNPLNPSLPQRLEIADTLTLLLPYTEDAFLGTKLTHIGFGDSYNRFLWAKKASLREAKKQFRRDFRK